MKDIDVGSVIRVNIGGTVASAKVRRIGPPHGQRHMATLDVGGEVAYCALRTTELAAEAIVAGNGFPAQRVAR